MQSANGFSWRTERVMKEKKGKKNQRDRNKGERPAIPAGLSRSGTDVVEIKKESVGKEVGGHYVWLVSVIILTGIIIYSNSFDCSFHFDDSNIFKSSVTRESASVADWIKLFPARPVGMATFALNYHFHKLDVWGYHFVNLVIHLANALLVFWLTLLTFFTPVMRETAISRHKTLIAFFTGMLFVSHPLATQSVTYIAQRFASLATFFYLMSVVLYVKGRLWSGDSRMPWVFFGGCVISAVLAMLTKEIAFTLPFAILLYEFCFLKADPWKFDLKDRSLVISAAIFVIFVALFFRIYSFRVFDTIQPLQGYTYSISAKEYLLTQFNVIVTYLRLLVLPVNQMLDYDYPISRSLFEGYTFFSLLFLLAVVVLGVWTFKRWRLFSFGIFWFFLTMAVESSILPVSQNVIFEHRTYLSSFGFFLAVTSFFFYLTAERYKQVAIGILTILVCVASVLTYQRNNVWKTDATLYTDNYKKAANKPRVINSYGKVLVERNDLQAALRLYSRAIELNPNYDVSYYNSGCTKAELKDYAGAIADYSRAISLNPQDVLSYYNRAYARTELKDFAGAIADYEAALKLDPYDAHIYNNLGNLKAEFLKDFAGSIQFYTKAITLNRNNVSAYTNRGNSKYMLHDIRGACEDWKMAASLGYSRIIPAIQSVCR